VTSQEFRDRLIRRARHTTAELPPEIFEPLEAYFRLLGEWNGTINLTALPMRVPTDETFDRLLVEPLAAARQLANAPATWFDLGSGGGSPAIPIKIARPALKLTMIESRTRKAAFLREAVRVIGLAHTSVASERFEEVAKRMENAGSGDLVTVRAVKSDLHLFDAVSRLLNENGRLLLFRTSANTHPPGFDHIDTVQLMDAPKSYLSTYRRMFHVEQSH
jgi:16S rRNA (guanine527-N7)-methyltransferase